MINYLFAREIEAKDDMGIISNITDCVGTGKTYISLSLCFHKQNPKDGSINLVLGPHGLFGQWKQALDDFGISGLAFCTVPQFRKFTYAVELGCEKFTMGNKIINIADVKVICITDNMYKKYASTESSFSKMIFKRIFIDEISNFDINTPISFCIIFQQLMTRALKLLNILRKHLF